MPRNKFRRIALLSVLAGFCPANASVLLDTDVIAFTPARIQFGRISRNGEASVWGDVKPFPGVVSGGVVLAYESFTVNNGIYPFIQISLDDPTASLFMSAYLNSYNPINSAPNYGLNVNYLGDPGLSQLFGNPSFFQIMVLPNSQLVIPINEITPGGGNGKPFELLVEGFVNASFGEVPEPRPLILGGSGILALLLWRARRGYADREQHRSARG